MSRVYESDNPICSVWIATLNRSLNCRRGQALLREMEAALA